MITQETAMFFKQFYLGCLAHASYLIGSEGVAAVVDPQRDVDQYLETAQANGLVIKYVIETHLHADFVSGHRELADRTNAEIVFSEKAGAAFPHVGVKDGDELRVGNILLTVIETPGHTPESISVLAVSTATAVRPTRLFTGDTLFIGEVGRPDLVGSKGFTAEQMAGLLYDSLHEKLLRLPDEVEVYPAHGAGSMCGRNISRERMSTIGEQRKFNYALQPMTREAFITMMTTDLPEVPAYFAADSEINRTGAAALRFSEVQALSPESVQKSKHRGRIVLDVRPATAFGTAHLAGSLNIGLDGQFASWAGSLIPVGTPIVIVADDQVGAIEAVTRLARVGLESVEGYLDGGIYGWDKAGFPVERVPQMPVDELNSRIEEGSSLQIIDVRRPTEYVVEHVRGARNAQLSGLREIAKHFDKTRPTVVVCGSGYRSSTATSLLTEMGFTDLYNLVGGTAAWVNARYPTDRGAD